MLTGEGNPFGSHAYGKPTSNSDIDLFIVADIPGLPAERVRHVRRAIREQASVDIVVRSPKDVKASLKGRDWFVQEVFEKGRVLDDAETEAWISKAEGDYMVRLLWQRIEARRSPISRVLRLTSQRRNT